MSLLKIIKIISFTIYRILPKNIYFIIYKMEDLTLIIIFLFTVAMGISCFFYPSRLNLKEDFKSDSSEMTFDEAALIISDMMDNNKKSNQCGNAYDFCLRTIANCSKTKSKECKIAMTFCDKKDDICTTDDAITYMLNINEGSEEQEAYKVVSNYAARARKKKPLNPNIIYTYLEFIKYNIRICRVYFYIILKTILCVNCLEDFILEMRKL